MTPQTLPRSRTNETWASSLVEEAPASTPSRQSGLRELQVHRGSSGRRDGSILAPSCDRLREEPSDDGVEPGHTLGHRQAEVRMLLSFQRPSPPGGRGFLPEDAPRPSPALGAEKYSHNSLGGAIHPTWEVVAALTACRKLAHRAAKCGAEHAKLGASRSKPLQNDAFQAAGPTRPQSLLGRQARLQGVPPRRV
jgi:hypothetical protein